MSTDTDTQPTPTATAHPEFTVLTRVASIPIISSSLETINNALASNTYTSSPYAAAIGLSNSAYKYAEPIQAHLAPLIIRADGYANKAVDVVESRYPYPFKAKPEDVADYVRERKESVSNYVNEHVNVANKTIDEKVKNPAFNVAQDIDHRFTPIVDYLEATVSRLNNSEAGPSSDAVDSKYQYQRALALSRTLKDNIYIYSNEQIKQIQAHSVLVQRATETAQSITTVATSSINSAQTRIHTLSDNMLAELQKLQASTASLSASLHATATTTIHNSTSQLQAQIPPQIQHTYAELSASLSAAATELAEILKTKDLPLQEKVTRVGHEVRERVNPLLESVMKGLSDVLARGKAAETETTDAAPESPAPAPTHVPTYAEVAAAPPHVNGASKSEPVSGSEVESK